VGKMKTVIEQINDVIKDLRNIKKRTYRVAEKYGNESFGLEYENAAGYIERAVEELKEARWCVLFAEKEKKKCEK
jgi:hypothetical protein